MRFVRFSQRLFFPLITSVLSGDLLYLYFKGCWYDPTKWIEITEVVALFIICILGIVQTVMEIKSYE